MREIIISFYDKEVKFNDFISNSIIDATIIDSIYSNGRRYGRRYIRYSIRGRNSMHRGTWMDNKN